MALMIIQRRSASKGTGKEDQREGIRRGAKEMKLREGRLLDCD
jgi:hypothetical protein